MCSEEMNGKNPEEMEVAESGEVAENAQVEVNEEPETVEAEAVEETLEEATEEVPENETAAEAEEAAETEEEVETEEAAEVELVEGEEVPEQEDLFAEEPAEPAPATKLKTWQLAVAIGVGLALVVALVFAVLHTVGVELKPRENNVLYKTAYLAEEEKLEKKADVVVATLGDKVLTNSELQLYYINAIYSFYSQNQYYMDYLGLNLEAPLSEQPCTMDETMNWEQYFLEAALQSWQSYTLIELMAAQDGYQVSDEIQAQIDSMPEQLNSIAVAYGYESAEDYLHEETAPGITAETYLHFNEVYYIATEYLNTFYTDGYPTDAEIMIYHAENRETFEANGITPDMGQRSNVRHILIQPKGGTLSADGTETVYTEEEWQSALTEAERILEAWKAGEATEESFATMANTYSEDGGSNTTGGLYEDIDPFSSYVPEFLSWAVDMSRQPGDVGIVKTTYGYHIMYFVEGTDYFNHVVGEQLVADRIQKKLAQVKENYTMDVIYKKVFLCEPVM